MNKTETIAVRLTQEQREKVEALAQKLGHEDNLSAALRAIVDLIDIEKIKPKMLSIVVDIDYIVE